MLFLWYYKEKQSTCQEQLNCGKGQITMLEIKKFEREDQDEIIKLVLHCQNDGIRPFVSILNQPELLCIQEKYLDPGGCFWTARDGKRIAGSIGLMNCGNGIGVLKKFFVYEEYRGNPHHLGQKLYKELLKFARDHHFKVIVLDTPKNTDRAHKFYDKAGFIKVNESDLPIKYDYPYKDSDFYLLKLS